MRAVLACQPIHGHLHPTLALASALRGAGHDVVFYSGSQARDAVEGAGFRFCQFRPSLNAAITKALLPSDGGSAASQVSTERWPLLKTKNLNAAAREWLLDTIPDQVQDLEGVIREFRPHLLIADSTLLGPTLVLKDIAEIPVVVFSPLSACALPGPDAPPWGRGIRPPRSVWTRVRCEIERAAIDWVTSDFRRAANTLRRTYGLPPLAGRVADEYGRAALFLVPSTPAFDYNRRDLPPSVQYIGPCVWDGGTRVSVPQWLEDLPRHPPVVHVTEGTIHTREPLVLRAAAAGLSNRPLQVIMTTGKHRNPAELDLGAIGRNVRVEQFVSHSALFPKTAAVVTTGGAGTITAALLAGVPLVVVPTSWDLPENAQRVVEAGAGLRLNPKRCTPRRLRAAVEAILAEPRYRENAQRLGDAFRQQGGPRRAVEMLEQLVPVGVSVAVGER